MSVTCSRRRSVSTKSTNPAASPTNAPRERLSRIAAETSPIAPSRSGRSARVRPSRKNMNGSEVARMKAKSFCCAYCSVASCADAVQVLVQARVPAAIEHVIVSVQAIRRCRTRSCAELRDDHVDRREARVARRGGDRGGGVLGPGGREQRDPEHPEHERLAALEDERPPVLDQRVQRSSAMQSPPASFVTLIPAGPMRTRPRAARVATTSRIARSIVRDEEDEQRRPDRQRAAPLLGDTTEPSTISAPTAGEPGKAERLLAVEAADGCLYAGRFEHWSSLSCWRRRAVSWCSGGRGAARASDSFGRT